MGETPLSWRNAHVTVHGDGLARCPWANSDPLYVAYHDQEWGRPEFCSRALFEKLLLDGFQAGLSWITILRKREAFRAAFAGFEPETMASFSADEVERLMQNAAIIRNRAKIRGAVESARAYLKLSETQSFSNYIWGFTEGSPIVNHPKTTADIPTQTALSETISRELKARGFAFCGPTIVYAFLQAVGVVDDHLVDCFVRRGANP